jgi:hypothetical protein
MPAKHFTGVRFDSAVQSGPSYSSPSYSSSSASPYTRYHAESLTQLPDLLCTVHPCIDSARPYVAWDMVKTPQHAQLSAYPAALNEAATNPPLPYMDINSPLLPWTVRVLPQTQPFVTVYDILYCIYATLREPTSQKEVAHFYPSPQAQQEVTQAFKRRCAALGTHSAEGVKEMKKGVKRIDCLGTVTKFAGLREAKAANGNPHAFELRIVS